MRWRRSSAVAAGLLLVVLGGSVSWAGSAAPSAVRIRKVDTSAYPTLGVTVSVLDETSPADFEVRENGSPASVITARPLLQAGRGVDVVLALDVSQSVAGAPLRQAVAAAQEFVRSLPGSVAVGILTFSNRPQVVLPITNDHGAILSTLGGLTQTQRGTKLYDAVAAAASMFSGPGQHNVILLTDGADVRSKLSLDRAIEVAAKVPASVIAVGLEGATTDFASLRQMANGTGGSFEPVNSADLTGLYQNLAQQLSRQFIVLYTSRGPAGAQVTIEVQTPDGVDSSIVLMPRLTSPGDLPKAGRPLLFGTWGLVVVLGLAFMLSFVLGAMIVGGAARGRRDRALAMRMAAPEWAQEERRRAEQSPASWVPGSFAQIGEAVAEAGGFKASLDTVLERAGLPVTPGEVVGASIITGLLGVAVGGLLFRSVLFGLLFGLLATAGPYLFVRVKLNRRVEQMHEQLPDVLMILASSMRAGHSFMQALDAVAKEIGEPAAPEFARVVTEIRLGRQFDDALNALAQRVGTEEFKWAILGVNVQREVGGNLAEILDTLSETVRERDAVRRQVKVLSAEGRLSVKILVTMPFLMGVYLFWINREYMRLLWTTRGGIAMLVVGIVLMVVGAVWARRMVRIDV